MPDIFIWVVALEEALVSSRMVVLVASAKVRTSRWVYNEISLAEEKGIPA